MKSSVICGIDVGNSLIKTVIAEINQETLQPRVIGVGNAPSNGLRRGMVVDMEEAVQSVRASFDRAEQMAGVKVTSAYVSINGLHIKTQASRGVIAVSRADNEIAQSDISRLIEAASTVSLPLNYEIIHVIPRTFIIDGTEHVKNALGMKGVRLEVEVLLVEGLSPYIRNLAKCINANGIEIAEFVFAPLAAAKSVLDKHQREYGVMLVDIGGGVSTLAMFHEGELLHTAVLPIGSRHITSDIAIAFRTSVENAENIKTQYGIAGSADVSSAKKESVDLSPILGEEAMVPRKHIAKIVDARIGELFDMISHELKKPIGNYMLPAGLVLSGGGANLTGMSAFAKDRLGLSVRIGGDYTLDGVSEEIRDPSYAVSVGLVLWGVERMQAGGIAGGFSRQFSKNIFNKTARWLKNFIP
ncbi:MAG: cell division protein FtsA [bacterium]|nr:cell division protein FtsA [bacterium]